VTKIQRETVAEKSATELRERILQGELRPGTQITEEAIAENLGVSRSTVRQVLNTLLLEDLLTRHPTTRVLQVTELSNNDLADIYRARRFLELGGVDAAAHASPEALAPVVRAVHQLEQAAANHDVAGFVQADFRCHAAVVALLGSQHLSTAHAQLMSKLRLTITHVTAHEEDNDQALAEHQEFCALLTSGAISDARANLAARLDHAEQALRTPPGLSP